MPLHPELKQLKFQIDQKIVHWVLFFLILGLGIFSRTWNYRTLPPGLQVDQASIGVDAYDLYKFGIDRNGVAYPTQFIAFGQEQNALYGYILIPFIALLGLKPIAVRLPILIFGILTLPLVYFIVRRSFDKDLGLLSMFFLAISPWHIFISQTGLDLNSFPFIFALGFACLLIAIQDNKWFIPACFFFSLSLYSYGTSYFIVPFFLVTSLIIIIKTRLINFRFLIIGLGAFFVLAIPVGLFIIINGLDLNTIHLGAMTIPRLPSPPRFLAESGGYQQQLFQTLLENSGRLLKLLVTQNDGEFFEGLQPYGYFYTVTFPLAIFGVFILFRLQKAQPKISFLLLWLISGLILGILQPIVTHRINIIFIPLIICIAVAVNWIRQKARFLGIVVICGLLIGFALFIHDYHGEAYRELADRKFNAGLLSAIQFASKNGSGPICVTDQPDQPYIYVLFIEKPDPESYLNTIQYLELPGPFRHVRSLLRYTFGVQNCANEPNTVYIMHLRDGRPQNGTWYAVKRFSNYFVYYPKQ